MKDDKITCIGSGLEELIRKVLVAFKLANLRDKNNEH